MARALQGDVWSMTVTEWAGTLVLGPPVVQLRTPPREIIRDVFFYVGSLFAMATSNGVRIGSFTPYGQAQMGTLLMRDNPARSLTGDGTSGPRWKVHATCVLETSPEPPGFSATSGLTRVGAMMSPPAMMGDEMMR